MLEKLDGLKLAGILASNGLKKFYSRQRLSLDHTLNWNHQETLIINNLLADDNNSNLLNLPCYF